MNRTSKGRNFPRAFYVQKRQIVRSLLAQAFLLLTMYNVGAAIQEPPGYNGSEPFGYEAAWTLELAPSAGSGASVTTQISCDLLQAYPYSHIVSALNPEGNLLTIALLTDSDISQLPEGRLAQVNVWSGNNLLHVAYSLELRGGEVIIVLLED